MWRADQHGPALGPQPARHSRRSRSALRTLAATDRSRRARDRRHAGHDEYRGGDQWRRVPRLPRSGPAVRVAPDQGRCGAGARQPPRPQDRGGAPATRSLRLRLRYLPAYSPDLSPIEPAWAKLKAELRRIAARTAEALHQALRPALDTITAQDAAGYFRHAGYSRPN